MTGSNPFLLEKTENFERSFKKLAKSYKSKSQQQQFFATIASCIEELILDPYPPKSRTEPLPRGIKLSDDWRFYKLVIVVAKGASGQVRLMYLVDETHKIIKPLWIYTHQQFAKRPPDQDIMRVIKEVFEE